MRFLCFRPENTLFVQICSKNQNLQFKLNFSTYTNSNVQNSTVMYSFSIFDWKYPFWTSFAKIQNCLFKVKFGTWTNSNMQNSMVMFTFFIYNRKYPFCVNLILKIKIVSLNWKLVPNGGVHLFCYRKKIPCLGKFGPKNENCWFKMKFGT